MKILSVGAELFREDGQTDRQTDMTKLIAVFRHFEKAPKNTFSLNLVHMGKKHKNVAKQDLEIGYFN